MLCFTPGEVEQRGISRIRAALARFVLYLGCEEATCETLDIW
jgi:hypothetical protein